MKKKLSVWEVQANAIQNKAKAWLGYIDFLFSQLNDKTDTYSFYSFRHSSLWSTAFSYIEWLLLFSIYETDKSHLSQKNVAPLLNKYWGWSYELGKLFWRAGRNPMAHVGSANSFFSYDNFNGLATSVSFDTSSGWSKAVTDEWSKYNSYTAVSIASPFFADKESIQIVTFFFKMLKDNLLPVLYEKVTKEISQETNRDKLVKLIELNRQIPH